VAAWSTAMTVCALAALGAAALVALRALGRPAGTAGMRVVGRLALEPRRSLYLVEVGGRCLLVGVGEGPIALVAELAPDALGDAATVAASSTATAATATSATAATAAVVATAAANAGGEPAFVRAWRRVIGGRA
jgi:flagellar biosynthetic protein FliO